MKTFSTGTEGQKYEGAGEKDLDPGGISLSRVGLVCLGREQLVSFGISLSRAGLVFLEREQFVSCGISLSRAGSVCPGRNQFVSGWVSSPGRDQFVSGGISLSRAGSLVPGMIVSRFPEVNPFIYTIFHPGTTFTRYEFNSSGSHINGP